MQSISESLNVYVPSRSTRCFLTYAAIQSLPLRVAAPLPVISQYYSQARIVMYEDQLAVAQSGADKAGEIAKRFIAGQIEIRTKPSDSDSVVPYNLVTDADVQCEQAIIAEIHRVFPDHAILAEESTDRLTTATVPEHLWIIDPIDGTNNFAHYLPHFGISIAYYHRGVPAAAVVYNPVREDLFTATQRGGAFYNGRPIQVDRSETLDKVLIGVGFYYDRGQMMHATLAAIGELFSHHIHGIRRFGAASLDLCAVAIGWYGAYFEYQLSPWDFAAGRLIVEEAGGHVTNVHGGPLPFEKTSILASNRRLHGVVQAIVSKHAESFENVSR